MRVRPIVLAVLALVVAAGIVAGVITGAFGSLTRSTLYATRLWSTNGPSTLPPSAFGSTTTPMSSPTPSSTPTASAEPSLPAPVLAPAGKGRVPSAAKIAARVKGVKVKDVGSSFSGSVLDVGSGKVLYAHNATKAYIPASTMKLLTAATALSVLGPQHTFTTTVVAPKRGQVILVGGGDPYLAAKTTDTFPKRASLTTLARSTAVALKKGGVRSVNLGYDDSLFSGPRWNPTWPDAYSDQVTPVSALWVDEGRVGGSPGPRVANPSKAAAQAFAKALAKQKIKVTKVASARADDSDPVVARVASMPVERIAEQVLLVSDNDAAEVLLRHAAIGAGKKGSFADGAATVRARLSKLGVWDGDTRVYDGSGLSRKTKVPADTMAKLLRVAAGDKHPELRAVITGLPVAGVEGSLRIRYTDDASLAGRGVVRGKTGTLRKVHTRAGLIRSRDGSVLAYAFLINNPKNEFNSVVWLDRVTTALSTCGCR